MFRANPSCSCFYVADIIAISFCPIFTRISQGACISCQSGDWWSYARATPVDTDNLLAAGRRPVNLAQDLTICIIRSEVEAMLREKANASHIINLPRSKASIRYRSHSEAISSGYITPQFQKFDGRRGNTRKHVFSLPWLYAHPKDADPCMREFTEPWQVGFIPGMWT